jgi:hypothetical protein
MVQCGVDLSWVVSKPVERFFFNKGGTDKAVWRRRNGVMGFFEF